MIVSNYRRQFVCWALMAIVLVAGGAFCACAQRSQQPTDTLTVAIAASPSNLDPRLAVDAEGSKITSLIYDGLMAMDDRLAIVPALAERYEIIGERTYRFHLRRDVRFHSGAPFTAEDVIATYQSIVDAKLRSPLKSAFDRIASMTAADPYTMTIELKEPYAPFLTALRAKILPKRLAELGRPLVSGAADGTGRYRLVRVVPESTVEIEANDDYWDGAPRRKRIVFRVIKEDNVRVLKLMKGDIDLVQNAIPPLMVKKLAARPGIEMTSDVGIVSTYLGFNCADPVLKDVRVRRAIAHAIDVDEIIAWRWRGLATPANSIIAPAIWAYDPALKPVRHDPALARRLLDEAGFADPDGDGEAVRFTITYKTTTAKDRIDIARMIVRQLANVGIGVELKSYEWGTFFRDIRTGNFQMYTLSWVGLTDPDIFYDVCHSSQMPPEGLNRNRYTNARLDRLLEEGRTTLDQERRKEIYDRVQAIVLEDLPFVPLWYEKNWVMYRRGLEDVRVRPDASYLPFANIW